MSTALQRPIGRLEQQPAARPSLISGVTAAASPRNLILVVVVLVLVWQVAVPIFMVLWGSVKTVSPGREGFWDLTVTFDNFRRAYADPTFWQATWTSLILATGATAFAMAAAIFLAWVVERTNTPFRRVIFVLATTRMILPGLLTTIAWIFLLSPRIGWINQWLLNLPFVTGPVFNVYTVGGMVWILGVELIPTSFLLMAAALRSIDPSLEEAAAAAGTSPLRILGRVTLPLMRPAILATVLLAFTRGLEVFEVPALVGYPYGINTYSTKVYYNTSTAPVDYGLTGAYAVLLFIVSSIGTVLYLRATSSAKRFMTVTGKGYRPRLMDLGAWRFVTAAAALLLVGITVVLPLTVLVWNSLLAFIQPLSWEALGRVSLRQYSYVLFTYPDTLKSFINSTISSTSSGVIVALLAAVTAWIVVKTRVPGRGALDFLAFAPTAVPGLILGLAFLWLYLAVPWGGAIYGTIWILMLAMVTSWLPFGMRVISANMSQIHSELEEASYAAGASWVRTFRTILLPLLSPGLFAAWIWVAVHAFRDVSTSLMLYSAQNQTVGVEIFNVYEKGSYNAVSALGIILVVVLTVLVVLANQLSGRIGIRQ
jgi:iron(III) transport system permease protein